jgi:hypothetical protein
VAGTQHALAVALGDQQERPIDGHHLIKEHRNVHGARFGHAVVARPGPVILVPLPNVPFKRGLGVELELMHVNRLAEILHERLDQARMTG